VSGVVADDRPAPRRTRLTLRAHVAAFVLLGLGVGALSGVLWWWFVDLPGYRVNSDGGASTSERGLAEFVSTDAWFTVLGVVAGLGLGWLAWQRLRRIGWPLVLLAAGTALLAALVCWFVGFRLGPSDFTQRLAAARPGDLVLIELSLRAKASLLVWPFAATLPVLVGSSLSRDDEEPRPILSEPARERLAGVGRRFRRRSAPPPPTSR
jgi:hypothetical protein